MNYLTEFAKKCLTNAPFQTILIDICKSNSNVHKNLLMVKTKPWRVQNMCQFTIFKQLHLTENVNLFPMFTIKSTNFITWWNHLHRNMTSIKLNKNYTKNYSFKLLIFAYNTFPWRQKLYENTKLFSNELHFKFWMNILIWKQLIIVKYSLYNVHTSGGKLFQFKTCFFLSSMKWIHLSIYQ